MSASLHTTGPLFWSLFLVKMAQADTQAEFVVQADKLAIRK